MNDYLNGRRHPSAEAIAAEMKRIAEKEEQRDRERRAWLMLCGSLSPIGRLSE